MFLSCPVLANPPWTDAVLAHISAQQIARREAIAFANHPQTTYQELIQEVEAAGRHISRRI
jgi:hypothetical protein